jgi:lipoprotein-anchoring transpeptidase ErfK/SrfK
MRKEHLAAGAALLIFACNTGFAFDLPGLTKAGEITGLPSVSLPRPAGAGVAGSEAAALDAKLQALRAEAAADPDKFLDERTPEEVSMAFGLPSPEEEFFPSRAPLSSALAQLAEVRIKVDLSAQRLTMDVDGSSQVFKISSGLAPEHATPGSGRCFRPDFMESMHYSSLYNKAPMPNSVFFNGNIAMHGTEAVKLLGQPASHGCVRLSKADSRIIFEAVLAHGRANTSVCVTGKTPAK